MSLLKLKSKTEPLYTNKNINNYDENINKQIIEPTKKIKENSSLIIGEGATIKGEIVEENEINELEIDGLNFKQVMSITKISSGIANNVIPETLKLNLNFRYSPELNGSEAASYINNLFSDYVEVEILNTSDGAMPNKSEEKISDFIKKTGAVVQPKQAWTDIARFFEHKIPCVNFGPGDPLLAHATNEHVSKKQLLESYELLSGYLGVKSE